MKEIEWDGKPIGQPGLFKNVPMSAYHQQLTITPSISSSGQRTIWNDSAAEYFDDSYLNPDRPPEKERPYFSVGRAAHHLLLLGRRDFDEEFAVRPEQWSVWRTNDAKKWKADTIEAGKTIITMAELVDITGMARTLGAHPMVKAGILDGLVERTIVYRDPETGVFIKSRPDCIPQDTTGADLKTSSAVDDDSLQRSITSFGYNQQGATVRSAFRHALGIEMSAFALVFVQSSRPYSARVIEIKPEDLDRGENQNRVANHVFARGVETGVWPGPGEQGDAEFMGLMPYAQARIDARLAVEIPNLEAAKYLRQQENA